eukprot:10313535-Alexandrium_andersonii.AAC.1
MPLVHQSHVAFCRGMFFREAEFGHAATPQTFGAWGCHSATRARSYVREARKRACCARSCVCVRLCARVGRRLPLWRCPPSLLAAF